MIVKKAKILNELGIHVRPSGIIIKETQSYSGNITLKAKNLEMELNSIMDLLALGLVRGDEVEISITGPDEDSFCQKLVDLLEYHFDFPPK